MSIPEANSQYTYHAPKNNHMKLNKTNLYAIVAAIFFVSTLILLYTNFNKPEPDIYSSIPTSTITTSVPTQKPSPATTVVPTKKIIPTSTISPSKYGLTKLIEMPAIGVKALFPTNASISLQSELYYTVQVNNGLETTMTFRLIDYDGGGRRASFVKQNPSANSYTFEEFKNGYLAYDAKNINQTNFFYYFTVISPTKMLVINNYLQSGFDLAKFKVFVSTITTFTPQSITPETIDPLGMYRYSDKRIIVWTDSDLGIKITAPEWAETRAIKSRDAEGKIIFYDWQRTTPTVSTYENQISFSGGGRPYQYLVRLDNKYSSQSFIEVVNDLLLPSGFCKDEQPRSEVLGKLFLVKETKLGDLTIQQRSMDNGYSSDKDCRAEDIWLIKAKNGQYLTSSITLDNESFKLEAY